MNRSPSRLSFEYPGSAGAGPRQDTLLNPEGVSVLSPCGNVSAAVIPIDAYLPAGVQPRRIQGIRSGDGVGDLFNYLFIKDIKSNRIRIAQ